MRKPGAFNETDETTLETGRINTGLEGLTVAVPWDLV